MEFSNPELALFKKLQFPYSVEFKDLRKQIRPNLRIENERQSLYSIIKYIRTEIISKKLGSKNMLLIDRFINDVLNIEIDVGSFYPPENLSKLDKFITDLKVSHISESDLSLVVYYILKDFSFTRADEFIKDKCSFSCYNLINSIYFLDRFDILKSLNYLNTLDQFDIQSKPFINHIIRLSNIIPFQPDTNLNDTIDVNQIQSFLDVNSSHETSLSVISTFTALNLNPLLQDQDILLIYIDALTDISVIDPLNFYQSIEANYSQDLQLSLNMILKIIVTKVLIKTHKQKLLISKLFESRLLDNFKFDQIYESLPAFQLLNYQIGDNTLDNKIITVLYQVLSSSQMQDEKSLRQKYPSFWQKLDEPTKDIKPIARDLLALKEIVSLNTDPQILVDISAVGNSSVSPKHISLKDLATYLTQ